MHPMVQADRQTEQHDDCQFSENYILHVGWVPDWLVLPCCEVNIDWWHLPTTTTNIF